MPDWIQRRYQVIEGDQPEVIERILDSKTLIQHLVMALDEADIKYEFGVPSVIRLSASSLWPRIAMLISSWWAAETSP